MKFLMPDGKTVRDVLDEDAEAAIAKGWTAAEGPPPNAGRAAKLINLSRRKGQMDARLATLPAGDPKRTALELDRQRVQKELDGLVSNDVTISMDTSGRVTKTGDLGRLALDALPAAGGIVGGMIGGGTGAIGSLPVGGFGGFPGAVSGAAIGGAGGEAARQVIAKLTGMEEPGTVSGAVRDIATQGGVQGVNEAAGQAIAGMGRGAGRLLYGGALRPSQALQREFGDVTGAAMRERIPVGKGLAPVDAVANAFGGWKSGRGSDISKALLEGSADDLNKLLAEAQARGVTFNARDPEIVKAMSQLVQDIRKQPLSDADEGAIRQMWRQFVIEHRTPSVNGKPGQLAPITPEAFNEMKRKAQEIARPIYTAQERGNPVTVSASRRAQMNRAIATGSRRAIEREIPDAAAANERIAQAIAIQNAMRTAEARNPQYLNGLNPTSWPGFNLMASPEFASRLGLGLDAVAPYLRQAPRFVPWGPPPSGQ